jgi:S1-C subfamily serine protease
VLNFDVLDWLLLFLLAAGVVSGFGQGGLVQAAGLVGAFGATALAVLLMPDLVPLLPPLDRLLRAIVLLFVLLGAFAVGEALGTAFAVGLVHRLGRGPLRAADRLAGAAIGGGQVVIAIWFLAPILAVGPSLPLASQIHDSSIVGALDSSLPPPGPVVGRLRTMLDPTGLPQVFGLFEPAPGPPVATPAPGAIAGVTGQTARSTVGVVGEACGLQLSGTGFAIAPGYVVTNAHVVAGERGTTDIQTASSDIPATVVLFDPELDVALLRAPGLTLPALRFSETSPSRGDEGAALGHPLGGALTTIPATVRAVFDATGYDIYGTGSVTRSVIELAADVEPGDSGGPFVGLDGLVDGVVFARSRTGSGTGYALSASSVAARVDPAVGRTRAESTGPCVP